MGSCTSTKQNKNPNITRQIMTYKVSISAFIWSKNAHNLFDFESNQFTRRDIEIDFSARLATLDNELLALTKNEWARNQIEFADIKVDEDGITQLNPISFKQDHRIWAVIKNRTSSSDFDSINHWDLSVNDIVKMGRIRLQLIDYKFVNASSCNLTETVKEADQDGDSVSCSNDNQGQEQIQCRVCFSRRASPENPLLSPCSCLGSVKYIHFECLQKWIAVQLKIKKGENFTQYSWKKMQCEICTVSFKSQYIYQGKSYGLIKIPKPNSSHMTLKVTSDDKCKEGMIYVVEFQNNLELKIGRVPECDIKLKDISVSRQHAILKLIPAATHSAENPSYILRIEDMNSKFGTLIYAQTQDLLKIKDGEKPVLYQVGKLLINFKLTKKVKKSNVSCYKHPEGIPMFNTSQLPQSDLPTNFNHKSQGNGSFQTHNDLNLSEIVMHDIGHGIDVAQAPIEVVEQQDQLRDIDQDFSVCDEHQQS